MSISADQYLDDSYLEVREEIISQQEDLQKHLESVEFDLMRLQYDGKVFCLSRFNLAWFASVNKIKFDPDQVAYTSIFSLLKKSWAPDLKRGSGLIFDHYFNRKCKDGFNTYYVFKVSNQAKFKRFFDLYSPA